MAELTDGFISLIAGMDEGRDADLLGEDQYVRGINVSSRGGKVKTRQVFKKVDISDSVFTDGKFQGGSTFSLDSADRLVCSVAGKIVGINTETDAVIDYSSPGIFDATVDRVHFAQAEQFFIAQDGINDGMIINYDGNNPDASRLRVVGDSELPLGTIMTYGHGRLMVLLTELPAGTPVGQRFFAAGDIMKPNNIGNVLKFTETDYLAGGGALSLPNELGLIKGMNFLRNQQSSTGLGSLIVFAQYGASAFAINASRIQWPEIDLSQVLFNERDSGTEAPYSIIPVNNDLAYRSKDGIRTLGYSKAQAEGQGSAMSSEPLSSEIDPFMAYDGKSEQALVSMASVEDKLFCLFKQETQDGVKIYKGMSVVDFDVITRLGRSSPPAWDGAYTGLNIMQILTARRSGRDTLYAFAKNETTGKNELYYLAEDETEYADGTSKQPKCRLYTKAYDFRETGRYGVQPMRKDLVQLKYAELYISDILGRVDITMYYRPHGHKLWIAFPDTATIEATDGSLPQYRHKIRFPINDDTFSTGGKWSYRNAIDFEFCIEWQGKMKIRKAFFVCDEKSSQVKMSILAGQQDGVAIDLQPGNDGIELDDFDYSIT